MDVQLALVTKIIETGDLQTPHQYNLRPEFFTSTNAKLLYEYVSTHFRTMRSVPTMDWIKTNIPDIHPVHSDLDIESLCGHVAEELTSAEFRRIGTELAELEERVGPSEAAKIAQQEFFALTYRFGKKGANILGDNADMDYKKLTTEEPNSVKVPWVWPTLQEATLGTKEEDVVIFYARRKTGKTWTLLQQAEYSARLGFKVLLVEPDMPEHQIMRRFYAIRAKFPYQDMVNKTLFTSDNPQAKANKLKLALTINSFRKAKNLVMRFQTEENDTLTMELVESLISDIKPNIVLIDQIHLLHMEGEEQKERLRRGQLVSRMRTLGKKYKVPMIGSTQSNRDNLIEESDKIEQNTDAFIRIELDKRKQILKYTVEGAREWHIDKWYTKAEYCENMDEIPETHPLLAASNEVKTLRAPKVKKSIYST